MITSEYTVLVSA